MDECTLRTQGAPIVEPIGATEDARACRRARPDGTDLIVSSTPWTRQEDKPLYAHAATTENTRERVGDTGGFGEVAAYSRAVRHGAHVAVSGTASLANGVVVHPGDAYAQTAEAIRKALAAAAELGARPDDVLRTRLLLAPGCDWREAVRAHAEAFAGIDPANTTYYAGGLIPEGALVEVELDAVVER
jgi:enamine deaminase RidA (YjgF/YER057c/UK114 family)